jgi:hypothetical protein
MGRTATNGSPECELFSTRAKPLEVFTIRGIVWPHGKFGPDERVDSHDRNLHSIQFENLRVTSGLFPCDPARPGHEIDDDFIRNANDFIAAHFVGRNIPNRIVGKHRQGPLDRSTLSGEASMRRSISFVGRCRP